MSKKCDRLTTIKLSKDSQKIVDAYVKKCKKVGLSVSVAAAANALIRIGANKESNG